MIGTVKNSEREREMPIPEVNIIIYKYSMIKQDP